MPVRPELAGQVAAPLGHAEGVRGFAPSGFPTSGTASVGVARQGWGRLGQVDNGPVAVSLGDVSGEGHTLVDRRRYRPKAWTTATARLDKAGGPTAHRGYCSRHPWALAMLQASGRRLPHGWSAGDDAMGRPSWFRRRLHGWGERSRLVVPGKTLRRDVETAPPASSGRGPSPDAALATRRGGECRACRGRLAADRRARRLHRAAGGRHGQTTCGDADAAAATRR